MREVTNSLLVLTQIPSLQSAPLCSCLAGEKRDTPLRGLKTSKQNWGELGRLEGMRFSAKGVSQPSPR